MSLNSISILSPEGNRGKYKQLTPAACHDLGLDYICEKISQKPNEQTMIMSVMSKMTDDPDTAEYRIGVFEDILDFPEMREKMMELLNQVQFLKDYGTFKREYDIKAGLWELLHRLNELHDYIKCVEAIRDCLDTYQVKSTGLKNLREYISAVYEDSHFEELKKDVESLRADTSNLKSITIGINLNQSFEADAIGLVSVNNREFKGSGILGNFTEALTTKEGVKNGNEWKNDFRFHPIPKNNPDFIDHATKIGMMTATIRQPLLALTTTSTLANVPDKDSTAGITHYFDREVSQMLSHITKKLGKMLGSYASLSITNISNLIPEFMYYIRWAEYIESLKAKNMKFCRAKVLTETEETLMRGRGIYNLKLAGAELTETKEIVPNDLDFDKEHTVYLLTGANRGGKTTITQAVGILYLLAQGGIYVPGESFEFVPVDCIYTHYPADEDKTMDLGRLGEECRRFKEIFSVCSEKSLLLLNETFSTTSFEEGYYIARDAVKAIMRKGIRTIYNTHMHKLAFEIPELNSEVSGAMASSLIVKSEGARRSFKVSVEPPVGMSFAKDIAEKYGVTYEMLFENEENN